MSSAGTTVYPGNKGQQGRKSQGGKLRRLYGNLTSRANSSQRGSPGVSAGDHSVAEMFSASFGEVLLGLESGRTGKWAFPTGIRSRNRGKYWWSDCLIKNGAAYENRTHA